MGVVGAYKLLENLNSCFINFDNFVIKLLPSSGHRLHEFATNSSKFTEILQHLSSFM